MILSTLAFLPRQPDLYYYDHGHCDSYRGIMATVCVISSTIFLQELFFWHCLVADIKNHLSLCTLSSTYLLELLFGLKVL